MRDISILAATTWTDVDLDLASTPGFGADLENLLNESALLAARKEKKDTMEEVKEATFKVVVALKRKAG